MELINAIRKGLWQCESRHKNRLEQEKKTPIEKNFDIYNFSIFLSTTLKCIPYDLFLFIPMTANKACFITEEGGKNLNLKEIYDPNTYYVLIDNLNEFSLYYDRLITDGNNYVLFNYDFYEKNKNKPSEIIWRILGITIPTKISQAKIVIIKLTYPDSLKAISDKLEIPEGYLFILLSGESVNFDIPKDKNIVISDVYINYIKEIEEQGLPLKRKTTNGSRLLEEKDFDVFLCHNSNDKPAVKDIGKKLELQNIKVWLDEMEIMPGRQWIHELQEQIDDVKSAAVFVGADGLGPWQIKEIYVMLEEFDKTGRPIIPVLLSDAPKEPELPSFLKTRMWVDFRKNDPDPLRQLIWGIKGKKALVDG